MCILIEGVLAHQYQSHQVLLDLGAQYLMLGKEVMNWVQAWYNMPKN